jgi:hypothetical protein
VRSKRLRACTPAYGGYQRRVPWLWDSHPVVFPPPATPAMFARSARPSLQASVRSTGVITRV